MLPSKASISSTLKALASLSTSKTIITYAWDKTSSHKISGHLPEAIDKFLDLNTITALSDTNAQNALILIPEIDPDIQERIKLLIKDKYKPEYHELILNNIVFNRPTTIICSSDIIFVDGGLPDANIFLITDQESHESHESDVTPAIHLELCSKDIWFLSRFKNIKTIKSSFQVKQDTHGSLKLKNMEHVIDTNIVIKYSSIFQSRITKNLKQLGIRSYESIRGYKDYVGHGIHEIFDSVNYNQPKSKTKFRFWYNNQFQKNINMQYYNYKQSVTLAPIKLIRGFKGLKRFKKRNPQIKGSNRILIYAPGNCRSLGDLSTKVNFVTLIKEIKLILDLFESPEILYLGANPKDTSIIDSIELLAPITFVNEDQLPYMNLFQSFDTYFYTGTIGNWDCNPRLLKESFQLNKSIIISEFVSRKRNDSCNVPIREILQKIRMKDKHPELKEQLSQDSKNTLDQLNHLKERSHNEI